MKFYYTYVLLSDKDKKIYFGFTENLLKRVKSHNDGRVASTKNRRSLKLIYFEGCLNKKEVVKREKSLKTGFGRAYLKRRIKI